MRIPTALHRWNVSPKRAVGIQRELAGRIISRGRIRKLRLAAGVDMAFTATSDTGFVGVVVWDVRCKTVVEQHVARRPIRFPYVPGLLSFREAPAILAVLRRLRNEPEVVLIDGQGMAHPRAFGLASHVGLLIDRPTVGCAKSLLIGRCQALGTTRGSRVPIEHGTQCIGMAVRTRDNVKPVYVSVGHRISLAGAVKVILATCNGFRIPEPTRLADQLVARAKAGL